MVNQYKGYLRSEEWRVRKKIFLRKAGYKCHVCGAKDTPLHVHHITYAHFGDEWDSDCVVLCKDCHEEVHEVVDYANLNKAKCNEDLCLPEWLFLPHMRFANTKLILVCAATFAKRPLRDYEDDEIFMYLTDNDKSNYVRFESKVNAIEYVNYLLERETVKEADARAVIKRIQSTQEGLIFLRRYYDEISLSDKFHWKYNEGSFGNEFKRTEAQKEMEVSYSHLSNPIGAPPPVSSSRIKRPGTITLVSMSEVRLREILDKR